MIDDQINLPRFIAMELRVAGYQVSISHNDDDDVARLSKVKVLKPDLIVLNWELRCTSGSNICRQLRIVDSQVPIVVITAKDEESCQATCVPGVQKFLTKPFSMHELQRIIKYHLKSQKPENEIFYSQSDRYVAVAS